MRLCRRARRIAVPPHGLQGQRRLLSRHLGGLGPHDAPAAAAALMGGKARRRAAGRDVAVRLRRLTGGRRLIRCVGTSARASNSPGFLAASLLARHGEATDDWSTRAACVGLSSRCAGLAHPRGCRGGPARRGTTAGSACGPASAGAAGGCAVASGAAGASAAVGAAPGAAAGAAGSAAAGPAEPSAAAAPAGPSAGGAAAAAERCVASCGMSCMSGTPALTMRAMNSSASMVSELVLIVSMKEAAEYCAARAARQPRPGRIPHSPARAPRRGPVLALRRHPRTHWRTPGAPGRCGVAQTGLAARRTLPARRSAAQRRARTAWS